MVERRGIITAVTLFHCVLYLNSSAGVAPVDHCVHSIWWGNKLILFSDTDSFLITPQAHLLECVRMYLPQGLCFYSSQDGLLLTLPLIGTLFSFRFMIKYYLLRQALFDHMFYHRHTQRHGTYESCCDLVSSLLDCCLSFHTIPWAT